MGHAGGKVVEAAGAELVRWPSCSNTIVPLITVCVSFALCQCIGTCICFGMSNQQLGGLGLGVDAQNRDLR